MKKVLYVFLAAAALLAAACQKENQKLISVPVQLTQFGDTLKIAAPVSVASAMATYNITTDDKGFGIAKIPVGSYTASISFKNGNSNYNGSKEFVVDEAFADTVKLAVTISNTSALILKEVYNAGCQDNAGKTYTNDSYIIVYNNSDKEVDASRMCVAMNQISAIASINKYPIDADGIIEYEKAGWTPASYAIWWFQSGTTVKIAPYSQIVIAVFGAVNHSATVTNSVDLSNADYCMYDNTVYTNTKYSAPAAGIPTANYMKTLNYGGTTTTAWPWPNASAAPFLLIPEEGVDITQWVKVETNFDDRSTNKSGKFAMVPISWVLDALDIWPAEGTTYFHRFPKAIEAGHHVIDKAKGYTMYRNVDKAATEAIAGNSGKLVYNYAGAVNAETDDDPSGIDAEASIAAGAKIVYMDTNNCAKDFHMRKVASIKK